MKKSVSLVLTVLFILSLAACSTVASEGVIKNNSDADKTSSPNAVIASFFSAFEKSDYKTMKLYCTEECVNSYFHNDDVNGMKWAKAKKIEDAFDRETMGNSEYALFVSVEMEASPASALFGATETSFYVKLIRSSDGSWKIDSFPTGL